ncbi:MAG: hypothetical protein ABEK01_04315 [Candidatus Nanohaloarchaea archaeon]
MELEKEERKLIRAVLRAVDEGIERARNLDIDREPDRDTILEDGVPLMAEDERESSYSFRPSDLSMEYGELVELIREMDSRGVIEKRTRNEHKREKRERGEELSPIGSRPLVERIRVSIPVEKQEKLEEISGYDR